MGGAFIFVAFKKISVNAYMINDFGSFLLAQERRSCWRLDSCTREAAPLWGPGVQTCQERQP